MPKPAHVPTEHLRGLVKGMALCAKSRDEIAEHIGIAKDTLYKHYRAELDYGGVEADSVVVGKLFEACKRGEVAALIFWCKTRLGWREVKRIEHEGEGGNVIVVKTAKEGKDEWLEKRSKEKKS